MYRSVPGGLHEAGPNPQPALPQRLHFCSSSSSLLRTYVFWERLRGCADRSWPSGRTTFPTIASPSLPDEPPDDDDHIREGHPKVHHPSLPLRAPHELLVGVVPGAGPLHDPPLGGTKLGRLALWGDLGAQTTLS